MAAIAAVLGFFVAVRFIREFFDPSPADYVHALHDKRLYILDRLFPLAKLAAYTCVAEWLIRLSRANESTFLGSPYTGPNATPAFGWHYGPIYLPVAVPHLALVAIAVYLTVILRDRRSDTPIFSYTRADHTRAVLQLLFAGLIGLILNVVIVDFIHMSLEGIVMLVLLGIGAFVIKALLESSGEGSTGTISRSANSHFTSDGNAKVSYRTQSDANAEARRLQAKDGARMNSYLCGECSGWHVGHAH